MEEDGGHGRSPTLWSSLWAMCGNTRPQVSTPLSRWAVPHKKGGYEQVCLVCGCSNTQSAGVASPSLTTGEVHCGLVCIWASDVEQGLGGGHPHTLSVDTHLQGGRHL